MLSKDRDGATDRTPLTGVRVLAVEDHTIGRLLLAAMLEALDVTATLVESSEEALAAADAHVFDVVLVDLGLPDIPGERLAQRLAGRSGTRDAAIVAVTGHRRPETLPPAFALWLEKPYSVRDLYDHLRSAVADHRRRA